MCWILIFLIIFIILLTGSYYAYRITFHCGKRWPEDEYVIPEGEQFEAARDIIRKVCRVDMHLPDKLVYPFIKLGARLFGNFNLEESSAACAVQHTKIPLLLIHGEDDRYVPCSMSRKILENVLK